MRVARSSAVVVLLTGLTSAVGWGALAGAALAQRPLSYGIVALPADEARKVLADYRGAVGVGVFPDERDGARFWTEVSSGGPRSREGVASPLGGRPCLLGDTLDGSGVLPRQTLLDGVDADVRGALERTLCTTLGTSEGSALHRAIVGPTADAVKPRLDRMIGAGTSPIVVLGHDPRTPVVVGLIGRGRGLLDGGIARRPGIVTPYDVTATILNAADVSSDRPGVAGKPLRVRARADAVADAEAIAARLERDAAFGPAHAGATIGVLLGGGVFVTALLLLARMPSLALRSARGGGAAVLGYVASLFVQTSDAGLRSIPIVVAYLAGAAWPGPATPERVRRHIGGLLGAAAAAIAVLTVAAALRPAGEPALSLWADPLVSWRFFGLRNHLASMLQIGVFAAVPLAMREPSPIAQAAAGAVGAVVVGAAVLGANFVAVLTLAFGASLIAVMLWRKALTVGGLAVSGGAALAAFAIALLADSGSPASHGGRAVRSVARGGLSAGWDFLTIRWRANVREISSLSGGWFWAAGLLVALVLLLVWAARYERVAMAPRAVVAGSSSAALAALLLEDTGFLAGGIIALAAGLTAATLVAERITPRTRTVSGGG